MVPWNVLLISLFMMVSPPFSLLIRSGLNMINIWLFRTWLASPFSSCWSNLLIFLCYLDQVGMRSCICIQVKLQTIKKGSSSIDEYLLTIGNLANQLAAVASPVSDIDLFYFIMGGLRPGLWVLYYHCFTPGRRPSLWGFVQPIKQPWGSSFNPSFGCGLCHCSCRVPTSLSLLQYLSAERLLSPYSWPWLWKRSWWGVLFRSISISRAVHYSITGKICLPSLQQASNHMAIDCYNCLNMAYQGRNPSRQPAAMNINADPSHEWLTDYGATHHGTPMMLPT